MQQIIGLMYHFAWYGLFFHVNTFQNGQPQRRADSTTKAIHASEVCMFNWPWVYGEWAFDLRSRILIIMLANLLSNNSIKRIQNWMVLLHVLPLHEMGKNMFGMNCPGLVPSISQVAHESASLAHLCQRRPGLWIGTMHTLLQPNT